MEKSIHCIICVIFTITTAYEISSRFGEDEVPNSGGYRFEGHNFQFRPRAHFSSGVHPFLFTADSSLPYPTPSPVSGSYHWSPQPKRIPPYASAENPSLSFDFSDYSGFRSNGNTYPSYPQWNRNIHHGSTNTDKGYGSFGFDSSMNPSRFGDNGRSHPTGNWFPGRERYIGRFPNGQGLWSHDRMPPYFCIYPTVNKGCPCGRGGDDGFTTEENRNTVSTEEQDITTEGIINTLADKDEDYSTTSYEDTNEDEEADRMVDLETKEVVSPRSSSTELVTDEIGVREMENSEKEIEARTEEIIEESGEEETI